MNTYILTVDLYQDYLQFLSVFEKILFDLLYESEEIILFYSTCPECIISKFLKKFRVCMLSCLCPMFISVLLSGSQMVNPAFFKIERGICVMNYLGTLNWFPEIDID